LPEDFVDIRKTKLVDGEDEQIIIQTQITELDEEIETIEDRLCKNIIFADRNKMVDAFVDAMHAWMKV
jgi:hypothetical protein